MDQACWEPVWLGILLSPICAAVALAVSAPMAWLLVWELRGWRAWAAEILLGSPLVLPLISMGLYASVALSLGASSCDQDGVWLLFSSMGKTVCAVLFAIPFTAPPLLAAFRAINPQIWEAAATLRADRADQFWSVALPMARSAMMVAGGVGCAQSVAAFGVMAVVDAGGAGDAGLANGGVMILIGVLIASAILRLDPGGAGRGRCE